MTNPFEEGLSRLRTVNSPDDIINDVSVVQRVRNHSKPQLFMFSRIDRTANEIIMNLITLCVRNVVKVLRDNVCNLKMPQFDILHVLLVMYDPSSGVLLILRLVRCNLEKITSSRTDGHTVIDMVER